MLLCGTRAGRDAPATVSEPIPGLLVCTMDGIRYEYHVPSGREGMYDDAGDPRGLRNVLHRHEALAQSFRAVVAEHYGTDELQEIRAQLADDVRRLRALGYL